MRKALEPEADVEQVLSASRLVSKRFEVSLEDVLM